jgi:hypothetical protein
METIGTIIIAFLCCASVTAQSTIPLPDNLPQGHPRLITTDGQRETVKQLIKNEEWAGNFF